MFPVPPSLDVACDGPAAVASCLCLTSVPNMALQLTGRESLRFSQASVPGGRGVTVLFVKPWHERD